MSGPDGKDLLVECPIDGSRVTVKVWRKGKPGTLYLNKAMTKSDPTNGVCTYQLLTGDLDVSGEFKLIVSCTKSGSDEKTQVYDLEVVEAP